ncbi:hypothetical protein QCN29_02125 [Streptomyces sp. HNM0663]|uniref:Lipoprotein n=1 Tax=Streptomyces chengmaiensis TaxID=3040919 RepID=A0ABT6HH39_9ACTN|nr:hypothetical protein [Streptomyces chengmaiensis]MDH2387602.1 hypothetical protein [Streptomyces chengmaiensis]
MRLGRKGAAVCAASAVLLAAAITGCDEKDGEADAARRSTPPPAAAAASPSASEASAGPGAGASTGESPSGSASPSGSPTGSARSAASKPAASTAASTPPAGPKTAKPPVPTLLGLHASTRGGRLNLVRGGAAQEFTITLHNGNTHAYRHLRLAFQMEFLFREPGDEPRSGPGFVLERWDRAAGVWRAQELRIANDAMPHWLYEGGEPLARDAVRTERFRLRAGTAVATGSTPLMIYAIDTDAPRDASLERARPGYFHLPHTTRAS